MFKPDADNGLSYTKMKFLVDQVHPRLEQGAGNYLKLIYLQMERRSTLKYPSVRLQLDGIAVADLVERAISISMEQASLSISRC